MGEVAAEARVSSMNAPPRRERYAAMRAVYDAVHDAAARPPDGAPLEFSCANLSYNYDDEWPRCSIVELDRTARIVVGFVRSY